MDSKQFYKKLDSIENELTKKINRQIELNRSAYKDAFIKAIKKSNFANSVFIIEPDIFSKITNDLFGNIDELNIVAFSTIGEYYYNVGIGQLRKILDEGLEEISSEDYQEKVFEKVISGFILARGLNFTYSQELDRRKEYFNSQMTNATMGMINDKIQPLSQKEINDSYKNIIATGFNTNDELINDTLKTQKGGLTRMVEAVAVYVASESVKRAYEDNGVEKVIRHAEVDEKTCDYCLEKDGKIYDIGEVDIPSHSYCRCWTEPYKEDEE